MPFFRCPKETPARQSKYTGNPKPEDCFWAIPGKEKTGDAQSKSSKTAEKDAPNLASITRDLWIAVRIGFIFGMTTGAVVFGTYPLHKINLETYRPIDSEKGAPHHDALP